MSADNWRELLDDPEVEGVIGRALNGPGRRYYWASPGAFDDLEPWLWDQAVTIAENYSGPPPNAYDPRRHFWASLYSDLVKGIVEGWHYKSYCGAAGSAKRQGHQQAISFEYEDAEGMRVIADMAATGHRRIGKDDPLAVVLRIERLERTIVKAERMTTTDGFTAQSSPYCSENLCCDKTFARGLCVKHYMRERTHEAPLCTVDGCTQGARSAGLCATHYGQSRRAREDIPRCSHDDCEKAAASRGMCNTHYQQARAVHAEEWAAERAARRAQKECQIPGCDQTGRLRRGLCERHFKSESKARRAS